VGIMNISKDQKLGLIIIIVALSILLILILNSTDDLKRKESKVQIKQEVMDRIETQNELQTDKARKQLIAYDFILVNEVIGDFFVNINNKNYSMAYYMVESTYKSDFDISFDIFKSNYDYNEKKLFTVKDIVKYEDSYMVDVLIESLDKEKQGVIKKTFTLIKKGNSYLLADIGIKYVKAMNKKKAIRSGITATLQKIYWTDNGVVAIISFENNMSSYLNIKADPFGFYAKIESNVYTHSLIEYGVGDYQVVPGVPKKYKIRFEQADGLISIGYIDMGISETTSKDIKGTQIDLFELK
jgi:hypothetical protein